MNRLGFGDEGICLEKKDIPESCDGHVWEDKTRLWISCSYLLLRLPCLSEVTSHADTSLLSRYRFSLLYLRTLNVLH